MAEQSHDLTGISASDCPYDCTAERCVISGLNICGHPFKSGLQGALAAQPDVAARYSKARKMLHKQKLNVGGDDEETAPAAKKAKPRKRSKAKPKPKAKPAAEAPAPATT